MEDSIGAGDDFGVRSVIYRVESREKGLSQIVTSIVLVNSFLGEGIPITIFLWRYFIGF